MKRFLIFFSLCFISASFFTEVVRAQDFSKLMADLKEKLGEVTIDRVTYNQSVEVLDEARGKIKYESVAVTEKGESTKTSYEFYITDVDKNTLIRKPSGKKFFVSLWLNNKQKFIKYYKDDKFEIYTDNIEILVLGADIAENVIDIIKAAIPLVKNTEKTWNTSTEALTWLGSNIGEVKEKSGSKQQSFSFSGSNNNLVDLTVKSSDSKGSATEEKYSWNIIDMNKMKLSVKISAASLNVNIDIKNNDKFIRFIKGGELQNYVSSLDIASGDIDNARNIIAALSTASDKSKAKTPEFKTTQAALDFVKAHVGEVPSDQKTRQQKIDFLAGNATKCNFIAEENDSKGKTVSNLYEFYLADIDPNVNFKVSGKKVIVPISVAANNKFIRYSKDNNIQNFTEDLEIYFPDIESARDNVAALNIAFKGSKDTPAKFNTIAEAMNFLQTNIQGENIGTDEYKLSFKGNTSEPFESTYLTSKTDAKGTVTEENLFYPYLIDINSVKIATEGKYLSVTSMVAGKKALVKKMKKDQNSFVNELSIMCFDVKKAKDIATALRFLSSNTMPKPKVYVNKQAAMEFVKKNIGDIGNGGKTIKQKLEVADDNPCKATLTINTTDDKGKSTEEIYEFSLSDLNKQLIDFKPAGSNISIVLSCKNKQKLIKFYKDGTQQSFAAETEIFCTDVFLAQNISEALKFVSATCE